MEKPGSNTAFEDGDKVDTEKEETDKLSRREFLKGSAIAAGLAAAVAVGGVGLAAAARPLLDLLGGNQGKVAEGGILDQLQPEELQSIKDTTWTNLTEVLNGPQFSEETLNIQQIEAVKGHNSEIAKEEIQIQGSLRGIGEGPTSEVGINFTLTFAKGSDSDVLGLRTGSSLGIGIFRGKNAGDMYSNYGVPTVRDPQDMEKRFVDIASMLKKILKIPDNTPFIPEQDFNGLATFTSNKIGYGLFISTRGIDGKSVTVNATEGMLVDSIAWQDSARRYGLVPSKISFEEVLAAALRDLRNRNVFVGGFRIVKDAPATEYIRQLGEQYLPNQVAQVSGR